MSTEVNGGSETTVKLVSFSGKSSDWEAWYYGFRYRGVIHKYAGILDGKDTVPTESEYTALVALAEKSVDDKKKIRLYDLNMLAMSHLISSMDLSKEMNRTSVNLLRNCNTTDYPYGNAHAAVTALKNHFQMKTVASAQQLQTEYNALTLQKNQSPAVFIAEKQRLRTAISEIDSEYSISDKKFLLDILGGMTKDYLPVVDSIGFSMQLSTPSVLQVQERLCTYYQQLAKAETGKAPTSNVEGKSDKGEKALFANGFKGKCNKCGKYGHKAAKCTAKPSGKKDSGGTDNKGADLSNIQCHYCHENGHYKGDCPKLKSKKNGGGGSGSGTSNSKKEKAEVALPVTEKYTCLATCDRCGEHGFLNRSCETCLVGTYCLDMPKDHGLGQCNRCMQIGAYGETCESCNETDSSGEKFESFDTNSIYLDEMEFMGDEANRNVSCEYKPDEFDLNNKAVKDIVNDMIKSILAHPDEVYRIRLFMEYVAKARLGDSEFNSDSNVQGFVRTYVYNLVNMGIDKVGKLVANIMTVNDQLVSEGFKPFTEDMLDAICHLSPLWIIAEYRHDISMEIRLPDAALETLEPHMQILYRNTAWFRTMHDVQMYPPNVASLRRLTEKRRKITDETPEQALVEFTYFVASKSLNRNLWVGDSGASCHMTCSLDGMTNLRDIDSPIQVGTGDAVACTKVGDKMVRIIQEDGTMKNLTLKECKYVPELFTNLFSITKALDNGWNISNKGINISLSKEDYSLTFDKTLRTDSGAITAVEMIPRVDTMNVTLDKGTTINVNKMHLLMGHACESTLRKTAEEYGLKLSGTFVVCPDCARAKAKQKNVDKVSAIKASRPGERFFIDVSSTRVSSFGDSKFWLLIVDHHTDVCWSAFLKKKSDLPDRVATFITHMKQFLETDDPIIIRCDNAGENLSLQSLLERRGIKVKFEFTPPGSPQYNGVVERKFATLYARVRSLLNSARLSKDLREGLWAEAAQFATDIENSLVTAGKQTSSWYQFYGVNHPIVKNVRQFGEVAIVEEHRTRGMRSKLEDRGKPCLYLGRAKDHASDVYRFFSLETNSVIHSCNVTWLNKTYEKYKNIDGVRVLDEDTMDPVDTITTSTNVAHLNPVPTVPIVLDDDDDDDDLPDPSVPTVSASPDPHIVPTLPEAAPPVVVDESNPRVDRELSRLGVTFADVDVSEGRSLRSGREMDTGHVVISLFDFCLLSKEKPPDQIDPKSLSPAQYKDYFSVPVKFDEAWNHPCPFQRKSWHAAIKKELAKMAAYKVWTVVKRSTIPKNRKCVKHKWVFDIKRNGVFRARLVACGYSQQPGVDFQESFSPVVNDSTFRMLVVVEMVLHLDSRLIDIETAFLNGELEEEIYMDAPQGLEVEDDECVLLEKALYGLVQSARQFFRKYRGVLLQLGFTQSVMEPCLFVKKTKVDFIIVAVYVDDCYVIGHSTSIDRFIVDLQKAGFKLKIDEKPTDYLSCELKFNAEKTAVWLGQPHLIKRLEKSFGHLVAGKPKYSTPGTPNYNVIRPTNDAERIAADKQKIYRSAVGTLLQFVKHTRPDISNPVRELSKCMDAATSGAFKEMCRVVKFVLDTRDFGLLLSPSPASLDDNWSLVMYSDSDWAGDRETRRSVSGYILFLLGCPILWKSKQQATVTLSSAEAEYVALSEATKEIKFVAQTLESIGIKVKYPIIVHVDNVGAIFMSENITATNRTRHIDARHRFVHEVIEDGIILIQFVRTEDNRADPFTKNTKSEVYEASVLDYMVSRAQFDLREGVRDVSSPDDETDK